MAAGPGKGGRAHGKQVVLAEQSQVLCAAVPAGCSLQPDQLLLRNSYSAFNDGLGLPWQLFQPALVGPCLDLLHSKPLRHRGNRILDL